MSLRGVISRHGASYTVSRPGAQTTVNGRVLVAAPSTFPATMYVEPATTDALEGIDRGVQVTRELQRIHKIRIAFSLAELRERDFFTHQGEVYDVILVDDFHALSGAPHYKAVAVNRVTE